MSAVDTVQETLVNRFGYKKRESKELATEIIRNLNNYLKIQEAMRQKIRKTQ
jgi:hypothetical protein